MRADNLNVILHNMSRNPDDWRVNKYHALHKSGVKIWIGNGLYSYHIEKPKYQELGFIERFRLHKQIKLLNKNKNILSCKILEELKS